MNGIEKTVVSTEKLKGPRGSKHWVKQTLSDGRILFTGPDYTDIPKWIEQSLPKGTYLIECGSKEKMWRKWITQKF